MRYHGFPWGRACMRWQKTILAQSMGKAFVALLRKSSHRRAPLIRYLEATTMTQQPKDDRDSMVEALSKSKIYSDYQEAFTKATGLPLELHAPHENCIRRSSGEKSSPFCALMAK